MEVISSEDDNNVKEAILTSKPNGTSDMLQSTNIVVQDDTNLDNEACDHFSIREYVAQASKQDPNSCSPFETDILSWDTMLPVPPKKFRRWDCGDCLGKVISTEKKGNQELALSSDQRANNNMGTCLISFLGTSLVPHNIVAHVGTCKSPSSSMNGSSSKKGRPLQAMPTAASPDTSDNEPLRTLIKSDKWRVMQEHERTKTRAESEKSKEILEIMATTSRNSDLPESTVSGKISKVHGKKTKKVRSLAEIIGNQKLVLPKKDCTPDNNMTENLTSMKENQASECAKKSGLTVAKSKKRNKEFEVLADPQKECTAVDGMDEDLTLIKEHQANHIAYKSGLSKAKLKKKYKALKVVGPSQEGCTSSDRIIADHTPTKQNQASEVACKSGLVKVKLKNKYKALEVVDDTSSLKCWLKKRSNKRPTYNKFGKLMNLEGQNLSFPSSSGLSLEKPSLKESDKKELLIGTFVKKKRTRNPRKFVYGAAATGGEIAGTESYRTSSQLTGNGEANSKKSLLKKRKTENSKSESGAQRVWKKKQKISENNSNDIPMDIVELLAKSLREKHLADDTDSNSNSNTISNSNLRESTQNKPPSSMLVDFSRQKSAFNKTSEAGTLKFMPHPIHSHSSNHSGNINLRTASLEPAYGYMKQFPNGYPIHQPGMVRCVNWDCTQLQLNANPSAQPELYRNEVIPATHLLQLMNASTSSSTSLNLGGFTTAYNLPLMPNYYQNLNQNQHKLFRPLPRIGVFGSQLQKEITSPTSNCGTQSGFRIGNGPVPAEGTCIINRNPADFTIIDETNEYMIDGREIKPITWAYYGNIDSIAYTSRGFRHEQGTSRNRLLYNSVVN